MTDAEYKAAKKRVQAVADRWRTVLGLGWWRITFVWSRTEKATDEERHGRDFNCIADTSVKWQYLDATITFYLPMVTGVSDDHLDYIVRHEFMHVLVREMRWQDHGDADNLDHEERVATTLAKAFAWTREAGVREGRKQAKGKAA